MHSIIYHICSEEDWDRQKQSSVYVHPSLKSEGFIHCATADQVEGVLKRYFDGATHLVKLEIKISSLVPPCIFELATNEEYFPHIYGSINMDAIMAVSNIK